jgi:serine/threonine protein kinase
MTAEELATVRANLPPSISDSAFELADALVRTQALTEFQATVLYEGKAIPLVLGEYTILKPIGAGGMGQVFKARHRRMDRLVAIKLLSPAIVDSPEAVRRFERESAPPQSSRIRTSSPHTTPAISRACTTW